MELEIKHIDPVLSDLAGGGAHAGLTFRKQGSFDFKLNPRTFLDTEGINGAAHSRTENNVEKVNGNPIGICEFSGVHLVGPSGLIVDVKNRICWRGNLIGWTNVAFWPVATSRFGCKPGSKRVDFPNNLLAKSSGFEKTALLAAPGFQVYGHWLLDVLPRLDRLIANGGAEAPVYHLKMLPWAVKLKDALLGKLALSLRPRAMAEISFHERLAVPTYARNMGILAEAFVKPTWLKIDSVLARQAQTESRTEDAEKIFVSRSKWKNNPRQLLNARDIEIRFEAAGFRVIYPEFLSLSQQRQVFAGARVVVGEDGSAMHNTIYCKPGTRLGLIAAGRFNILHVSTANALGHRLTYIPSTPAVPTNGGTKAFMVETRDADVAIDKLLAV